MARSIRSKWKRKCNAIKRERYAVKELARLKKMLGTKDEEKKIEVMEAEEQVIFLDAGEITKKKKKSAVPPSQEPEDEEMSSDDEKVEVTDDKGERVFSTKTLKDQNGQYPVWLHKRKIAKMTNKIKKKQKKRSKRRR